jgi:hypothetical protein
MYRTLAALVCAFAFVSFSRGGDTFEVPGSFPIPRPSHNVKDWGPLDYDDTPGAVPGGLVFIRQDGRWIVRFGGALLPMRVRVTEPGPNGPVTTRMVLPSSGQSSLVPLALQHQAIPAGAALGKASPNLVTTGVRVSIPDPIGLLYVDGQLTETRGELRLIEAPAPGKVQTVRLRAAFKVGDNLLIEEKEVVVRAGQVTEVSFDGARATSVPLPKSRP